MTASEILEKYINFFKKQDHVQIANSSLVPENDPTTLFTSSGMQPLIPFLLGELHPQGKRLVNVQNCFRAQDIDEIGDNRHTTFFRMLGNWSLGDYFKKEQIPWFFEFLTDDLGLDSKKLYVTVFEGVDGIEKDTESFEIWKNLFEKKGISLENRISQYGVDKNWWSRSGTPDKMPVGEPGGPDTEVFFDFGTKHDPKFGEKCHVNCDCGRYMEIGNSVFMQYIKTEKGFEDLPKQNVDFGGGLERLVAATENKQDIFETSLFVPIIKAIEQTTSKDYSSNNQAMRIVADHFVAAVFISSNNVYPSNKEQGYILRRLIRRGLDNFYILNGDDIIPIIKKIVGQYSDTDQILQEKFEEIKKIILEEESVYKKVLSPGNIMRIESQISNNPTASEVLIQNSLSKYAGSIPVQTFMQDNRFNSLPSVAAGTIAFEAQSALGFPLDRTINIAQKKLGTEFNQEEAVEAVNILKKKHQELSRKSAEKKFAGGLADHSEKTIMGHTATHLLHKAIRDLLGSKVHQAGSNITQERVRFDYNFDRKLTPEERKKLEDTVNEKIQENLPVHFEIMPLTKAKEIGAIGLFDDKYADNVKVYFVGDYSKEFCGGPHVDFTGQIKRFKIIKEEALGRSLRRIYAVVGD